LTGDNETAYNRAINNGVTEMIKVHYSQKPFYIAAAHIMQVSDGSHDGSRVTMVSGTVYAVDEAPAKVVDLIRMVKP
jgi:short subunit fatty acids transporter